MIKLDKSLSLTRDAIDILVKGSAVDRFQTTNMAGQTVSTYSAVKNRDIRSIDLTDWNSGVYLVKTLNGENGVVNTGKYVKQ